MSLLGNSTQQDFDNLAQRLRTYEGAEQFVLDQLAGATGGVYEFMYPAVFFALALVGLMWWMMRLSPVQGARYLLSVAFVSALMLPTQVGNAQVPASFYFFNWMTTQGLRALQSVIDGTFAGPGGGGNFAATVHPLTAFATGAGGEDLRDTDLARTVRDYNLVCRPLAVEAGLTQAELESVGLAGGPLGVDVPGSAATRARALDRLKDKTNISLTNHPEHYYVAAREWWLAREGDKKTAPRWIKNTDRELGYNYDDGRRADPIHPERFWPTNCGEFYKLANMSMHEYQSAVAARSKVAALRAGIAPGEDKDGLVVLGAQITAAQQVNAAGTEKKKSFAAGIADAILGGLESLIVTFAMKAVSWLAELATKWFIFAIPAVAALAIGLMFVAWPLVVGMALVPGRERSIPEFLYYVVYIKLFLFFSYSILKVGGAIFLAAVDQFGRDGSAHLASMTFISSLAVMIGTMWGAPKLAGAVTFSQSHGLMGAMGLGAVGAQQITQAARTITGRGVNLISSPRGNLKPQAGKGAPPQGAAGGSAPGRGAGPTLKSVRAQVADKKPPPSVG